jgi:hypothetical protein
VKEKGGEEKENEWSRREREREIEEGKTKTVDYIFKLYVHL